MKSDRALRFGAAILLASVALVSAAPLGIERGGTAKIIVHDEGGPDVVATGFLYREKNLVVTCLHVVNGTGKITAVFESGISKAEVIRVLRDADLVLLRLDQPMTQAPLTLARAVAGDNALLALGFPLASPVMRSVDCKVRAVGGRKLKEIISDPAIQNDMLKLGFPSLTVPILDLEAALVPGMSGCPVFNREGEVVGVGNGGLEKGYSELTWAIDSEQVEKLWDSTQRLPESQPVRANQKSLFAAELRPGDGAVVKLGGETFAKLRTRKISELVPFNDDKLGLSFTQSLFLKYNPSEWQFDVYRNLETGAMFFAPEGSQLTSSGNDLVAGDRQGVHLRARFDRVSDPWSLQLASTNFERDAGQPNLSAWQESREFSYAAPITYPNGLIVRRRAWVVPSYNPQRPNRTLFETFAGKGNHLLSVAVVDEVYPRIFFDDGSAIAFGKMTLATQLASFVENIPIDDTAP